MGHTAELVAQIHKISREEMDEVALRSHNGAEKATLEGHFKEESVPLRIPQKKGKPPLVFDKDEIYPWADDGPARRPAASLHSQGWQGHRRECLGINDGASAMLIMSAEKARELGLKPLARIKAVGYGGVHPSVMGLGPTPAVRDLMKRVPASRFQISS